MEEKKCTPQCSENQVEIDNVCYHLDQSDSNEQGSTTKTESVPVNNEETTISSEVEHSENNVESTVSSEVEHSENNVESTVSSEVEHSENNVDNTISSEVEHSENNADDTISSEVEHSENNVESTISTEEEHSENNVDNTKSSEVEHSENNVDNTILSEVEHSENNIESTVSSEVEHSENNADNTISSEVELSENNVDNTISSEVEHSENNVDNTISSEVEHSENNDENTLSSEVEHSENNVESTISTEEEHSENYKLISDSIWNNENNQMISDTAEITENKKNEYELMIKDFYEKYFPDYQQNNNEESKNKDEIIKNLKKEIISGNISLLLSDVINGTKNDLTAEYNDIVYQIATTGNQKINTYKNLSTVNLGSCETQLKRIYHINENVSLIILKVDYKMDGLLIPVIGYEVYHPLNNSQLDLSYCSNTTVKINIPVSIDEDKLYKYDPNSDFYNDDCYAYTTEDGTDIIINDRKNEFKNNNLSLCENNCTYNGYDSNTKKALCECEAKITINLISKIDTEENILSNKFNSSKNNTSSLDAMKCASLLFSKDGLLSNIGSYIVSFTFLLFSVTAFIFYKFGYQMLEKTIKEIVSSKSNGNKGIKDVKKKTIKKSNYKKIKIKEKKKVVKKLKKIQLKKIKKKK